LTENVGWFIGIFADNHGSGIKPNAAFKEKIMIDDEGKQEDEVKQKKDLIIPRSALFGIGPAVVITAVLLSKNRPGELLLFYIGIVAGVIIARGYFKK
jgi:hypothetical protein